MTDLLEILESFNRKERFFLVGDALGNKQFALCEDFRRNLGDAVGLEIAKDAFVAMDYHLDWLSVSLLLTHTDSDWDGVFENKNIVEANQEDADFLVAFGANESHHLIMLEAKGYTGWTNSQMDSKAKRIRKIFGDDGKRYPNVEPHYCLVSPSMPTGLDTRRWPEWMSKPGGTPNWMPSNLPRTRRKPTRCDSSGTSSAVGRHFRIDIETSPGSVGGSSIGSARSANDLGSVRTGNVMVMRQQAFASRSSKWAVIGKVSGSFRDPFNRPVKHGLRVRSDDGSEYVVGLGYARKYLGIGWV